MKAMIFAAGLGTRLGEITRTIPKAMVEVGGVPMLQRVIEKIEATGVKSLVINVHHHADVIEDFLAAKDNFGLDIKISDEREELLDTGGGVLAARPLLGEEEPVILHNADILTDFDLRRMMDYHVACGADVTLLAGNRPTSRYLMFDAYGRMHGWLNRNTGEVKPQGLNGSDFLPMAFGGVHIINSSVFDSLAEYGRMYGRVFSITPFYISECERLKIYGYQPEEEYSWIDVGKPETLARARQMFDK